MNNNTSGDALRKGRANDMCVLSIQELSIANFRKFESNTFILNPRMNVFVGKNGSGKTALLEAACVVLGAYLAAFKTYVPSRFVFNIAKGDPRKKIQLSDDRQVLTTGGIPQYPCEVSCKVAWEAPDHLIAFRRVLMKEEGRTQFNGSNPMQATVTGWENLIAQANHADEGKTLPLVLYLSSARLWNENKATSQAAVFNRTDAYNRCLDAKHGIDLAFSYIQQMQAIAMEENDGQPFEAYKAILNAVRTALQEELGANEEVIFSTRFGKDIVAVKYADGTVIPFSTLSDGYRNVIRIILDIAVRMCILNPYLKGAALQQTPGIVVIDELDLSLHPTWQKRIVGILKELFPKIQFICATHSPFIIQSLEADELINLDCDEKPGAETYSGVSIEDIAEEHQGVFMPQYSDKKIKMFQAAKAFYDALAASASPEEIENRRQEMAILEAEFSDNPAYLAYIRHEFAVRELEVKHS